MQHPRVMVSRSPWFPLCPMPRRRRRPGGEAGPARRSRRGGRTSRPGMPQHQQSLPPPNGSARRRRAVRGPVDAALPDAPADRRSGCPGNDAAGDGHGSAEGQSGSEQRAGNWPSDDQRRQCRPAVRVRGGGRHEEGENCRAAAVLATARTSGGWLWQRRGWGEEGGGPGGGGLVAPPVSHPSGTTRGSGAGSEAQSTLLGSLDLHKFSEDAFPERICEILDPTIWMHTDAGRGTITHGIQTCMISVIALGISCSKKRPTERIQMHDVVTEMHAIRDSYLKFAKSLVVEHEVYSDFPQ